MIILNLILFVIFIYIVLYSIYTLTINIKAFGGKDFLVEQKRLVDISEVKNRLCVIIWATANDKRLYNLLKILDNQNYDRDKFEVHVVFKRDKETISLPQSAYGAYIHPIENPEYFSKDKAVSLFAEKMAQEGKFDAFVFLGANRLIDENYLKYVNKSVYPGCVLTGRTGVCTQNKDFASNLKCQILRAYHKYQNNVQNLVRTMFEMPVILDGENCVIASDIMEKAGRVCFETKNDELKFSLFLASNAIKPMYAPFMVTGVDLENFDASTPSFAQKFSMFKYYLGRSLLKPWYFKEFVFFIFKPDAMGVALMYLLILISSFNFYTSLELRFAFHLGVLLVVNFIIGAVAGKLNFREFLYIIMYPALILWQRTKIFTKQISLIWIENKINDEENVNSATVNCLCYDGKKEVMVRLVLVSEDGMRKVVFECGKRHITSDSFIRMYDAMADLVQKVKAKGFELKICQNCGNYCPVPDGTVDLLKGECQINSIDDTQSRQTLIWNTCPNFINLEIKGIVDNITKKEAPTEPGEEE